MNVCPRAHGRDNVFCPDSSAGTEKSCKCSQVSSDKIRATTTPKEGVTGGGQLDSRAGTRPHRERSLTESGLTCMLTSHKHYTTLLHNSNLLGWLPECHILAARDLSPFQSRIPFSASARCGVCVCVC